MMNHADIFTHYSSSELSDSMFVWVQAHATVQAMPAEEQVDVPVHFEARHLQIASCKRDVGAASRVISFGIRTPLSSSQPLPTGEGVSG